MNKKAEQWILVYKDTGKTDAITATVEAMAATLWGMRLSKIELYRQVVLESCDVAEIKKQLTGEAGEGNR